MPEPGQGAAATHNRLQPDTTANSHALAAYLSVPNVPYADLYDALPAILARRQIEALEECYRGSRYVSREAREKLQATTNLTDREIKIWFQHQRMIEKNKGRRATECNPATKVTAEPLHLKDICRRTIWAQLGGYRLGSIDGLDLPLCLQRYLFYE
ncbi:homeobox domain containing protein [Aphelenchoides avenae]|nr:homeobox domain containing protein [Aphelenchus avenae]